MSYSILSRYTVASCPNEWTSLKLPKHYLVKIIPCAKKIILLINLYAVIQTCLGGRHGASDPKPVPPGHDRKRHTDLLAL